MSRPDDEPSIAIPDVSALIEAVRRSVERRGGLFAVRDGGGLQSALARIDHMVSYADTQPDAFTAAALAAEGIVRNHPFADGNKRAALIVVLMIMELNEQRLDAPEMETAEMIENLADRKLDGDGFIAFLKAYAQPI